MLRVYVGGSNPLGGTLPRIHVGCKLGRKRVQPMPREAACDFYRRNFCRCSQNTLFVATYDNFVDEDAGHIYGWILDIVDVTIFAFIRTANTT